MGRIWVAACIAVLILPPDGAKDSLCSVQLIMEDEGLSRLAQTIQVLVDLADSSQRAPKQETSGAAGSTQC